MKRTGFFRCTCGKLHTFGGISVISTCTCGLPLLSQMLGNPEYK